MRVGLRAFPLRPLGDAPQLLVLGARPSATYGRSMLRRWSGGSDARLWVAVGAGVGWFPLGPREVYCPTYRVSPRYVSWSM